MLARVALIVSLLVVGLVVLAILWPFGDAPPDYEISARAWISLGVLALIAIWLGVFVTRLLSNAWRASKRSTPRN